MAPGDRNLKNVQYSDQYKEDIFQLWYNAGRPSFAYIMKKLKPDPVTGETPVQDTVITWARELGWRDRADDLDREVQIEVRKRTVEAKSEMLARHAEVGDELIKKGLKYLRTHDIESEGAAIRAIVEGTNIERASRGLSDGMSKVATMTDRQLVNIITSLMDKVDERDFVEVDIEEGEYQEIDDQEAPGLPDGEDE